MPSQVWHLRGAMTSTLSRRTAVSPRGEEPPSGVRDVGGPVAALLCEEPSLHASETPASITNTPSEHCRPTNKHLCSTPHAQITK